MTLMTPQQKRRYILKKQIKSVFFLFILMLFFQNCSGNGFKQNSSVDSANNPGGNPDQPPVTTTTLPGSTTTTLPPVTTTTTTMPGATTTTTMPPVTTTTMPPVGAAPVDIIVTASFESAGVIIKLPASTANTVSARLMMKKSSDSTYKEALPFVRYDGNNMATSLFELQENISYDIQVLYTNASGVTSSKNASFMTRKELVALPTAVRTVNVSTTAQLQSAINSAVAGDHIVLANAIYGAISVSNKNGSLASPIVIRGATAFNQFSPPANTNRAIIDGNSTTTGIQFDNSSNFIVDNIEVRNGGSAANYGSGVYLRSSSRITVQKSYIHDSGSYNILVSKGNEYSGDINQSGYHLIQNNNITDTTGFANCTGAGYNGCNGITYYGVQINNNGGAGVIIRNNEIHGHVDNIATCGDEAQGRQLAESTAHVLRLTSTTGIYLNHDTEVYGNQAWGGLDDDIETDGICVNLRIYKNRLGKAELDPKYISAHPITIAPTMPGPIYIVRNVIENFEESAVKLNTGGNSAVPLRNIFLYHNTFVKQINLAAMVNLWYAIEGDHNVPVKNIQFKNNIFYAPNGSKATDAYNQGSEHPVFNYNLWYTPTAATNLFEWYAAGNKSAANIAGFRTISGQEANGLFALPNLNSNFTLTNSSPAIDKAVRIPGINDTFNGAAPDIGASEY